jgi:3-phenylpropionate/trans-cinnamate dioxygenase ferredoxin subunit
MSEFIAACPVADIPTDRAVAVTVSGIKLALVRCEDGIFAVHDACSHADVALSEGEVSGCTLECWLHGSQFDVRTGQPLSPPATAPVPTYSTRVAIVDGIEMLEVNLDSNPTSDATATTNRNEEAR